MVFEENLNKFSNKLVLREREFSYDFLQSINYDKLVVTQLLFIHIFKIVGSHF